MNDRFPSAGATPGDLAGRQAGVWRQICQIAEGLALAPAISCLSHRGVLGPRGVTSSAVGNPGFVAVALRALAQQGRLPAGDGESAIWWDRLGSYRHVPALLAMCRGMVDGTWNDPPDAVSSDVTPVTSVLRSWESRIGGHEDILPDRITTELLGFAAAPAWMALADKALFLPFEPRPCPMPAGIRPASAAGHQADQALRALGWVAGSADAPWLTVEGRMASVFAGQFRYPLSYLPLLCDMDTLLFGDPAETLFRGTEAGEGHLDRAADIRFSTEVFRRGCAPVLRELALPLFHRDRSRSPPTVVVDVGCGEATLLADLYQSLRRDPATASAARDLLLIGVENNPVAEAAAWRTLGTCGAHFSVIRGDISHPDAIARRLVSLGIDLTGVLHVNKSVIHDRALVEAPSIARSPAAIARDADMDGVFARPDGTRIDAAAAHDDLVRFFRRWRPHLAWHGMIALEPHALSIPAAASLSGRSLSAMMEALHGFSCQYLTTADGFAQAAGQAGLCVEGRRLIGSPLTGHAHMSCCHLTAGPDAGPPDRHGSGSQSLFDHWSGSAPQSFSDDRQETCEERG